MIAKTLSIHELNSPWTLTFPPESGPDLHEFIGKSAEMCLLKWPGAAQTIIRQCPVTFYAARSLQHLHGPLGQAKLTPKSPDFWPRWLEGLGSEDLYSLFMNTMNTGGDEYSYSWVSEPLTIHTHECSHKSMSWITHSNHEGAWRGGKRVRGLLTAGVCGLRITYCRYAVWIADYMA